MKGYRMNNIDTDTDIWSTIQEKNFHLFFLSSFSLSSTTGAAGMLNHHSLILLVHLSVLGLLGGEFLVNNSRNKSRSTSLVGRSAIPKAIKTSASIALSVACLWEHRNIFKNLTLRMHAKYMIMAVWRTSNLSSPNWDSRQTRTWGSQNFERSVYVTEAKKEKYLPNLIYAKLNFGPDWHLGVAPSVAVFLI